MEHSCNSTKCKAALRIFVLKIYCAGLGRHKTGGDVLKVLFRVCLVLLNAVFIYEYIYWGRFTYYFLKIFSLIDVHAIVLLCWPPVSSLLMLAVLLNLIRSYFFQGFIFLINGVSFVFFIIKVLLAMEYSPVRGGIFDFAGWTPKLAEFFWFFCLMSLFLLNLVFLCKITLKADVPTAQKSESKY